MTVPEQVEQALRSVVDPELGVNVVDLGLVYGIEAEGNRVRVRMGLTSPTCPMGGHLREQAEKRIREQVPGIAAVDVDLVREPPWDPSRMSEAARRLLGWR